MTKKIKVVMLLGIVSLFAPSITHAQRNLITSGSALHIKKAPGISAIERAKAPQITRTLGRAITEQLAASTASTASRLFNTPFEQHMGLPDVVKPTYTAPIIKSLSWEETDAEHLIELIDNGVSPDFVMSSAVYLKIDDYDVFKSLIAKGLNPMAADKNHFTALHWFADKFARVAVEKGEENILPEWMAKFPEADPNVRDIRERTPLHLAGDRSDPIIHSNYHNDFNTALYDMFRQVGADPFAYDIEKNWPHLASYSGHAWRALVGGLRTNIRNLIVKYEFQEKTITEAQKSSSYEKAKWFLSRPMDLVEHLLPLGATPDEILQGITKPNAVLMDAGDYLDTREMKSFIDLLVNKYGAKPLK